MVSNREIANYIHRTLLFITIIVTGICLANYSNYNSAISNARSASLYMSILDFNYDYTINLYNNLKISFPNASDSELVEYMIDDYSSKQSFISAGGPKIFRDSFNSTKGTGLSLLDLIEISYYKKDVSFIDLDNGAILFWITISLLILTFIALIVSFFLPKKPKKSLLEKYAGLPIKKIVPKQKIVPARSAPPIPNKSPRKISLP